MNHSEAPTQQRIGEWDKIFSTYWWKAYYLPGQKSEYMKGYSKKCGHNEAADKDHLLIVKVMMLHEHGYIDKCSKIEIHERMKSYCRADDPVVITLFPDRYEIAPEGITKANIYKSMKALYEEREGAGKNKYILPFPTKINPSTDEQVKAAVNKNFRDLEHLMTELESLRSIGVPEGLVVDTYRKIIEKPRNQKLR